MQRYLFNLQLAIEQVAVNKLRSVLTALGIVFGVGAVIAMLAIGSGARQSILDQMKLIGVNNIVIESLQSDQMDDADEDEDSNEDKAPFSPGLTLADMQAIQQIVPGVELACPEIVLNTHLIYDGSQIKGRTVGIANSFFDLNNLSLSKGVFFTDYHEKMASPVCIIGGNIEKRLFSRSEALGSYIKAKNTWLKVVGVLENKNASIQSLQSLGLRNLNDDIYVPTNTLLVRFRDRGQFVRQLVGRQNQNSNLDNIHQLDKITIRMQDSKTLQASANVMARILNRRHNGVKDYAIQVPELLLEQEQKTQDTFNFVLAAIAGISLLVGGIGIMNIMLASVLERTKEIGTRRSLGATQNDIIQQFVFEAVFISFLGGLIGILLGVVTANLISASADIPTVISGWSIVLSFGVSSAVGLVFGIVPAKRASELDPITALRT